MPRPKKMKECVRLSVVMSEAQAERIKYMAIQMSVREGRKEGRKEGRQISVSEAIRMAIEAAYPVPKGQADMFDK